MIHRLDVVDSTQSVAKELARGGAEHGTLVVARRQTAGRGRMDRKWLDVDEAVLASMVLRPQVPVRFATRLPLAVCNQLLGAIAAPVFCKWPNDLLIKAKTDAPGLGPFRKVGGVIVEAVEFGAAGSLLACCVVGVGINVRGTLPAEVRATAGVLADVGYAGSVEDLVARAETALAESTRGLDDASFPQVREHLVMHSATIGRRVSIDGVEGLAVDIDNDGALVLMRDDGVKVAVRAGDANVG